MRELIVMLAGYVSGSSFKPGRADGVIVDCGDLRTRRPQQTFGNRSGPRWAPVAAPTEVTTGWLMRVAILALITSVSLPGWAMGKSMPPVSSDPAPQLLAEMRQRVAVASQPSPPWDGPKTGPAARAGRSIAIICEDLRNGGILGVAQGIHEAVKVLGWQVKMFDATGIQPGREKVVAEALAVKPDGLILVGGDVKFMEPLVLPFVKQHIPIVAWHTASKAGAMTGSPIAINVSTDPLAVAAITAMAAVTTTEGQGGVVIFTDSTFEIATAKANAMAEIIRATPGWTLLEVRDVPIAQCAECMGTAIGELLRSYGGRWTHALAINDIYFDYAVPELILAGSAAGGIRFLSAGDGSAAAFLRIKAGTFQVGTVAEPLNLHGWQLVDELNRLMERQPVSGYVAPVHLVTQENIKFDGGPQLMFDPDNGYRAVYRRIWDR